MAVPLRLVPLPPLKRVEVGGMRHYIRDDNTLQIAVPSVTTVLSVDKEKQRVLHEWRERVGEVAAANETRNAGIRGSQVHEMVENYCEGLPLRGYMPHVVDMFSRLKTEIDNNLTEIRAIEGQMLSRHLRCAGTVDMVGVWNGKLSIIDWKTSKKIKRREWISQYFMQEAAYAVMWEENTGQPVEQLVTCMTSEDGGVATFIETRDNWIHKFIELRDQFEAENPRDVGQL